MSKKCLERQVKDSHRPSWILSDPDWLKTPTGLQRQADRPHYDEQTYGGGMGEKEKLTGSCAAERGGTAEAKVVRNKLL